MEQMPERLERTTIYESEHVCLYTDKVRHTSGYTVGHLEWEIPAGKIEEGEKTAYQFWQSCMHFDFMSRIAGNVGIRGTGFRWKIQVCVDAIEGLKSW